MGRPGAGPGAERAEGGPLHETGAPWAPVWSLDIFRQCKKKTIETYGHLDRSQFATSPATQVLESSSGPQRDPPTWKVGRKSSLRDLEMGSTETTWCSG